MPRTSEVSLRRMVAHLAQASIEDVEGVLEELGPRQRERVRALLLEFHGEAAPAKASSDEPREKSPAPVSAMPGLSPWLAVRLGHSALATVVANDDGAASAVMSLDQMHSWRMAPAALAALQDVAREARTEISSSSSKPSPRGRRARPSSMILGLRLWPA